MSKSVVLPGRIEEGGYGATVAGSVVAHLLFFAAIIAVPLLFPGITLSPGSGGGGGGDNNIIPVKLTDANLNGGYGDYKPRLKPEKPAVGLPKPEPAPAKSDAVPIQDPLTKPKKEKEKKVKVEEEPEPASKEPTPAKTASRISPGEQKVKNPVKMPDSYVATKTGPGDGGIPGIGVGSQGVGIGIGDGPGDGGGGGGVGDSWYARQVEKRIGSNWLRSQMGSVPSGKFATKISFYVLDNGAITRVNMEKSSGVITLDDSAKRAIMASTPLAPLPAELRGKSIKFTAVFEYPPPARAGY